MSKNKIVKIVTDINKFKDRVFEITSDTSYNDVLRCISDVKRALYENRETPALCAPQIGYDLRLFVVIQAKSEANRFKSFLNPMIVSHKGYHFSREKCLSIPDKEFIVPRYDEIHLAYQTSDGHIASETYKGAYSEVIQQMVHLLDGITLSDIGLDLDDVGGPKAFDRASNSDKVKLLSMYLFYGLTFCAKLYTMI